MVSLNRHGLAFFLLAANAALAAEVSVYRWTDDQGVVHFSSRPANPNATQIPLENTPPSSQQRAEALERTQRQSRALDGFARQREIEEAERAEQATERRRRERYCKELRKQWSDLQYGGPLYFKDAQGERHYLSEAQRQAEKAELRGPLERECGGLPEG